MEQNQTKIEDTQEPEGLRMAAAILESVALALRDDSVYAGVFEVVAATVEDDAARAALDPNTYRAHISIHASTAVSTGAAIAMLRKTPPTVLVNLCGMLLTRLLDDHLAELGLLPNSAGHKRISTLILERVKVLAPEGLDAARPQSVY